MLNDFSLLYITTFSLVLIDFILRFNYVYTSRITSIFIYVIQSHIMHVVDLNFRRSSIDLRISEFLHKLNTTFLSLYLTCHSFPLFRYINLLLISLQKKKEKQFNIAGHLCEENNILLRFS